MLASDSAGRQRHGTYVSSSRPSPSLADETDGSRNYTPCVRLLNPLLLLCSLTIHNMVAWVSLSC